VEEVEVQLLHIVVLTVVLVVVDLILVLGVLLELVIGK
jgi:hypothetical protein